MANRYSSQKTQIFWELVEGDAAPTRIGPGIRNLQMNEGGQEKIDATGLDDDDPYTLGGRKQARTWSFSVPYDPLDATHETLRTTPDAVQVARTIQIRFYQTGGSGVGRMLQATATMTKAAVNAGDNQALYLDFEFEISGAVTRPLIP